MPLKDQIIEFYGPQLGELAWHSLHVDSRLTGMSEQHAASILRVVEHCRLKPVGRPIRILEVGAYAHFGAHRAASTLGGLSVTHDVSPTSLRVGMAGASAAGIKADATLVAGDFHDLPFNSGYFDAVFCASSIHHTFRPWRVLGEMLRVTRPGGALHLENEPIGRAISFYGFRSNRNESFTPFEAELFQRGSLYTFSSPIPGSRPEMLFGMIENERIPLDMILDTLTAEGPLASLQLVPMIGAFDEKILALPHDADLEASLAHLILDEIHAVTPGLTERDKLLGCRLPDADSVWLLSYRVAPLLRSLITLSGQAAEYERARLFGGALQATVVKRAGGEAAHKMFQRSVSLQDAVYNDLPVLPGIQLHLTEDPIPAVEKGDLAALSAVYVKSDWEAFQEENGLLSMLNLNAQCRLTFPPSASPSMLLLRFYGVAAAEPYRVSLRFSDAAEISSVLVAQSESLLFRELLPAGCREILVTTETLAGAPLTLPRHVRVGIGRLIPVYVIN